MFGISRELDDLIYNYMALLESIFSEDEKLPDLIFQKYGLMKLTVKEVRKLEAMEMIRLYKEDMTLNDIASRFNMTDSGVYRRMRRWV